MKESELEALLCGAAEPDPALALIVAVGRVGRSRAWARALADEVLTMQDLEDEGPPEPRSGAIDPLRLAAAPAGAPFPAVYEAEGVRLMLTVDSSARVVARLEAGPSELSLETAQPHVQLRQGEDAVVPWLDEAPIQLVARIPGGGRVMLLRNG